MGLARVLLLGSASRFFSDYVEIANEVFPSRHFIGVDNVGRTLVEAIARDAALTADSLGDESFLCVPGSPWVRSAIAAEALSIGLSVSPSIVHPSASLSPSFEIGIGSFIGRLVSGAADSTIGSHCQVNRSASIGHHSVLEDFVTISPGAVLLGGTVARRGSLIGAGSVILPGVIVGTGATVGAGAVVTKSVKDGTTVIGNPAREVSGQG
jgi:sugar O-acyltransferase (sialic acid O-acetyltransferase NeuD family)